MKIVKKEILEFSDTETEAIQIVSEICISLIREATDPNLKDLAEKSYKYITALWEAEE